jgi:hypothetical protein
MRKLLMIIVLLPAICWGQKKGYEFKGKQNDSTAVIFKLHGVHSTGIPASGIGATIDFQLETRQDTIAVLLLVCDTSFKVGDVGVKLEAFDDGDRKLIYNIPNRIPYLWWQFGYMVVKGCGHDLLSLHPTFSTCPHFDSYFYFNQDKKPLPKNIVVWLSKEIKK